MGNWLDAHESSLRFWIFVAVCAYFAYAVYFAVYGLNFSISLVYDQYVYGLVSKNPWWWAVLYYGSEGIAGSVAIVLRAIGGAFAVYSAFAYWRKKDSALSLIRSKASKALFLEACAFLALIPSVIAAFAYYSSTEYLYYFDHTPGQLLLFGTGIPCPSNGANCSSVSAEAEGSDNRQFSTFRNHQVEQHNERCLRIRCILVQLFHALGSNNGFLPTFSAAIRSGFSSSTIKLGQFFSNSFWSPVYSCAGIGFYSSCNQEKINQVELEPYWRSHPDLWRLFRIQYIFLLSYGWLRSAPKRLV